jgi:hypothetical protein
LLSIRIGPEEVFQKAKNFLHHRKEINLMITKSRFALAVVFITIFTLAACAPTDTYLKWNQVDAAALMKTEAGKQAYNTIRFATYGPKAQQLYGYFLYRDGIEVQSEQGIPFEKLGKMTLQEVMADYQTVEKANMYSAGSMLNVQEYYRRDAIVGYTAVDLNIDVSIWDITQGDGPPMLRVVYKDLRQERDKDMRPMRRGIY